MSAIENSIVVSGHAHIEHEQEADFSGEHRSSAGGGVQDVVEANVKPATDTVKNAALKAEAPAGDEQAHEETGSDHADDSSSANNGSIITLASKTDDGQSKGIGKDTDSDFDSDSDGDSDGDSDDKSDSESVVKFLTRFQPRGPPFKSSTGKPAPKESPPSPSKPTESPPSRPKPTESPPSRPQKPATTGTPSK